VNNFLPFCKKKANIRDESKDRGVVDESSVEQQICGSTSINSVVREKCTYTVIASVSYDRQAVRQMKYR